MLYIRQLEISYIPEVVKGWNQTLVYDKVSEQQFEEIIFQDPNYRKEGNLVAMEDTKIVGFIGSAVREGILGKDGKGRIEERYDGYVKGFYVLDDYWDTEIKERLLKEVIDFMKRNGKCVVKVVAYTGPYFFPGIDIRYSHLLDFFEKNRFRQIFTIKDVETCLKNFESSEYQKKAIERAEGIGIKVIDYTPEMIDMMRKFVVKLNMRQWFPGGWEKGFGESGTSYSLVAIKGKDIVGWASYRPCEPVAYFGPIGVLEEYRNKGIGTYLLCESMLRLKELGVNKVVAKWAIAGFLLKNDWRICRKYVYYKKIMTSQKLKTLLSGVKHR